MNRHNPINRLVTAWVNREQVEVLVKNGINISEVIRKAIRAEIKKLGLVAILLSLSACAPAPESETGAGALGDVRFVESVWTENVTGETLDLTDLSPYNEGYAVYKTKHAECSIDFYLKGDSRTGPVHVWQPAQIFISPVLADVTPCNFLKTVTSYKIVGQTLTLGYDGDTQFKTFTWKSQN